METKSTHECRVYEMKLEPHGNADSLSIMRCEGYNICVNTKQWEGIKLGAFCQPDSIVDLSKPEFAFLDSKDGKTHYRVRCKKLRGIVSYGFMIPVDHLNVNVGDNVADILEIQHYDPELTSSSSGQNIKAPVHFSKYDVDAFLKFHSQFIEGEKVWVTEKINGANCRIINKDGQVYVGSRNFWKVDEPSSLFWQAYRSHPAIEEFIMTNPGAILFGEAYGEVKGMKYGCDLGVISGQVNRGFAGFDIFKDGRWLDLDEILTFFPSIPWVPILGKVEYNFDAVRVMCEGKTLMPAAKGSHIREGVIVFPEHERSDIKYGRIKFKIINPEYLEKH